MRTLAIVCAALALAGCATRIAAEDVDEAAARQAADADSPPLRLRALERGLQAMHDDAGAPLGHQSRVRGDFARAEAR
jgi:hypothetical protein